MIPHFGVRRSCHAILFLFALLFFFFWFQSNPDRMTISASCGTTISSFLRCSYRAPWPSSAAVHRKKYRPELMSVNAIECEQGAGRGHTEHFYYWWQRQHFYIIFVGPAIRLPLFVCVLGVGVAGRTYTFIVQQHVLHILYLYSFNIERITSELCIFCMAISI